MLTFAYPHKEELKKLYAAKIASPEMIWYNPATYVGFDLEVNESSWSKVQKVSLHEGKVVGYLSASIDRDVLNVTQIALVNFCADKTLFALDIRRFFLELLQSFNMINFSCVKGSPIEDKYRRLAKSIGGREVGEFKNASKLRNGEIRSMVWFEVDQKMYRLQRAISPLLKAALAALTEEVEQKAAQKFMGPKVAFNAGSVEGLFGEVCLADCGRTLTDAEHKKLSELEEKMAAATRMVSALPAEARPRVSLDDKVRTAAIPLVDHSGKSAEEIQKSLDKAELRGFGRGLESAMKIRTQDRSGKSAAIPLVEGMIVCYKNGEVRKYHGDGTFTLMGTNAEVMVDTTTRKMY